MEHLLTEKRGMSSDDAAKFLSEHRTTMMQMVPISIECARADLGAEINLPIGNMSNGN
jgi:hypothetical protein